MSDGRGDLYHRGTQGHKIEFNADGSEVKAGVQLMLHCTILPAGIPQDWIKYGGDALHLLPDRGEAKGVKPYSTKMSDTDPLKAYVIPAPKMTRNQLKKPPETMIPDCQDDLCRRGKNLSECLIDQFSNLVI